jgi:signal transduction histidine kinase
MPFYIASCYFQLGDFKKALDYAILSAEMENALSSNRTNFRIQINLLLSRIYEKLGNRDKAFEFLKKYQEFSIESDSLDESNRVKDAEVRAILDRNQEEINQLEQDRLQKEQQNRLQRLWIFSIVGALISAIILSLILYRNNKSKQKANALLKKQKEEIHTTLQELEKTQAQLIQSEKMASLGELTAGIAHEIQNPLNFINNFSEVNAELVEELRNEIKKGNLEEVVAIASDIEENEKKIKHHGQRAEGIIKGMLQHSRTSHGKKEITNINALADEYLRLAYHGLRAKDKSFNAEFKTNLDPSIPKIEMVSQDIGRVLLNLINNAFYACREKSRSAVSNYHPLVTVSTKNNENTIDISVKDNGPGISDDIKDKIFQPFFTTKPTGSGTGLGLSLSYDIVKAHGGELKVETRENKGSEFILQLPKNQ